MSTTTPITSFSSMSLKPPLLKALNALGYELPTQIQAQTIPLILAGRDVLGQAQTGTGKTAAFALPILSNLDLKQKAPQVLVLAPTRELAIQVAEAFKSYASQIKSFHVLPVYGGQEYGTQLRALQRGVHVIVGTPGRVMDHMRRGNIKLDGLTTLVLDEADEMLRMGFIDDVEWVLEHAPKQRQIALFSATMPAEIRKITRRYQRDPAEITVEVKSTTAETIRQRYWPVAGTHKLDALTRILEAETFDAMLVFVRTKTATLEVAEKLEARGYRATALNGDIAQKNRERIVAQLKAGKLDILVATDVAARGLDVDRISHVINYDIPHDTEAYVHRIGRTGRAGREGDAILFVAPRERRMLQAIEKATRKEIELMELPSTDMVNNRRIEKFKQRISDTLAEEDLELFRGLIEQYRQEHQVDALDIAAALARQVQGRAPFLLSGKSFTQPAFDKDREDSAPRRNPRQNKKPGASGDDLKPRRDRSEFRDRAPEAGMDRFRIEVGHDHKVKPGNIVGAIANEADIDSKYIGRIDIFDDHSLVDLPEGMPKELLNQLKQVRVAGQRLNISLLKSKKRISKHKPEVAKTQREKPKARQRDTKNKGKPKRLRQKRAV
ncbi:MAG: DEAD/DEAH box helicase [Gammaproteobacteria bacterium]|jgi:ATP-dependent RNA helicase DeaD|nr:DEAD/DEAH box helicase [Gammaproteobacteria bacterium]